MPRHSKNNTAGSIFTYHEHKQLDYGTKKQRLGSDAYRAFNACFLCLQPARTPVSCSQGHIACKECMYENILAQKKDIMRRQKLLESKKVGKVNAERMREDLAQMAAIKEFERAQMSLLPGRSEKSSTTDGEEEKKWTAKEAPEEKEREKNNSVTTGSTKRKFSELSSEIRKEQNKESLRRMEEEEKVTTEAARREKHIPSFWIPSHTPSLNRDDDNADNGKDLRMQTICTATSDGHPVTLKSLVEVKFTYDGEHSPLNKSGGVICPSCRKGMSNSSAISLLRSCGHIICTVCVDKFVRPTGLCFVCNGKAKEKDIVDASGEGTGYASGSKIAVAKKFDVAFQ